MVVNFDGMGPTWTVLVQKGLELYPNATHGVLSDADFTPTVTSIDKWQLKLECSKHMYKIRFAQAGEALKALESVRAGCNNRCADCLLAHTPHLAMNRDSFLVRRSMDGGTVRNMDWIYRNIPGAKVERRTHQSLNVPEQPGQTVYQTLIDLEVQVCSWKSIEQLAAGRI